MDSHGSLSTSESHELRRWRRNARAAAVVGLLAGLATTGLTLALGSPPWLMWIAGFLFGANVVLAVMVLATSPRTR